MMRVLALCSYPKEAAATRFRLEQFVEPLQSRGIELEVSPFLNSRQFTELYKGGGIAGKAASMAGPIIKRLGEVFAAAKYDVVLVQREAMIFGPAVVEWLIANIGRRRLVLDLDDATYVRYLSPTYGRVGSFLKFFGKTDRLIKRSSLVICGNRFIAEYAREQGTRAVVVPTVVDLNVFKPRERKQDGLPVKIGWIGTHSTFPFLEPLLPVLKQLADTHSFRLTVIGAGRADLRLDGVEVENLEWNLDREPEDFASIDIGLYPITLSSSASEEWIRGKSGFKAVQYMAVGVPFVMSPVGVCAEMGEPGRTHFNAETPEHWYTFLNELLVDAELRSRMGKAGRQHALANYSLDKQADLLAETLKNVATKQGKSR